MTTTNSSSRQDNDNPIAWQSDGQSSGEPAFYLYLERLSRGASRSEEVSTASDRLAKFISRNLVYTASPATVRNPYTQTLSRIWAEIIPSRVKPPTHLIEVGFKVIDAGPEPFLRVPIRLIDPTTRRLGDVQGVLNYVRSAMDHLKPPKTLPLSAGLKHGYSLIVFEALFVGWINERDLVESVATAASQPLFDLKTLTDRG